jgi:hypothetical protein
MVMGAKTTSARKRVRRSLTDKILTLCGSGQFGVREAIAQVTRRSGAQKKKQPHHQGRRAGMT